MTTEAKKPSERVKARTDELYNKALNEIAPGLGYRALSEATQVRLQATALERALGEFLDEQQVKLQRLERLAQPPRYVIAPHLQTEAERAKLLRDLAGSGMQLLPAGSKVEALRAVPIPCAVAMPAPSDRVLFCVPKLSESQRWRTGSHQRDDQGTVWEDDATSVGDEAIRYRGEDVTHWLPMPEVPT